METGEKHNGFRRAGEGTTGRFVRGEGVEVGARVRWRKFEKNEPNKLSRDASVSDKTRCESIKEKRNYRGMRLLGTMT